MAFERLQAGLSEKVSQTKDRLPDIPVEMRIPSKEHIMHPREIVNAVKEYKITPDFRKLKRRGLNVVPTRTNKGVLLGVVGTAAAIGAGYMWYKRLRETVDQETTDNKIQSPPDPTVLIENIPTEIHTQTPPNNVS